MQHSGTASALVGAIRRESGLTQAELARRAGMPRSVLNAYVRGHREPGVEALTRIAAAAGTRLRVVPMPVDVDPVRAGRILEQVLDLAELLPARRPGRLAYPPLNRLAS
jgi:transcriptional regulator with XRE-family HTH domain